MPGTAKGGAPGSLNNSDSEIKHCEDCSSESPCSSSQVAFSCKQLVVVKNRAEGVRSANDDNEQRRIGSRCTLLIKVDVGRLADRRFSSGEKHSVMKKGPNQTRRLFKNLFLVLRRSILAPQAGVCLIREFDATKSTQVISNYDGNSVEAREKPLLTS